MFLSRELLAAIVLGIGYYVGVHVGVALTFPSSPVSTVWPPNAILFAALLLTRPRSWWLMIAAVVPAHFAAEIALGVPLSMAACWFLSNVAEALLGATILMRYLGERPRFDRVRDLSVFLIVGVLIAPLLSSFLDAAFVALVGWRYDDYWQVLRIRLFSNALAALTLVPLIVIGFQAGIKSLSRIRFTEFYEAAALLMGICLSSALVFQRTYAVGEFAMFLYVPLPFLMWAAVRFGVVGVSFCAAIVAGFAITGVLKGRGPSAGGTPENAALTVQIFLVIAESSLMLLAASLAELRHSRKAAANQKESLDLVLNATGVGTWEWDVARHRVTWRSAQEETAGAEAPRRSRSRTRLLNLVHENDRAMVARAIDDALRKGGSGEIECRFLDEHGGYRWITSKGRVLTDDKGHPRRMIGVFIDTTHRKHQEMQSRAQRDQLTHLSRVSILGELSGAIAHELNQPLTAIMINAQVALRQIGSPPPDLQEISEILQDIVSDDKRAGEVIRRLRALFLRGAIEQRLLDVNECIEEVLRLEQSDLVARNVLTDLQLETRIPAIIGDRVQLQQVLLNLIVNARDAMAKNEPGDRTLRIVSALADGLVRVEICDNGHGIHDTEAIFEPFFSTKDHGIGMGLPICRTIITAHGGHLWANNNPVRGATLYMSIPAASSETDTITTQRSETLDKKMPSTACAEPP